MQHILIQDINNSRGVKIIENNCIMHHYDILHQKDHFTVDFGSDSDRRESSREASPGQFAFLTFRILVVSVCFIAVFSQFLLFVSASFVIFVLEEIIMKKFENVPCLRESKNVARGIMYLLSYVNSFF